MSWLYRAALAIIGFALVLPTHTVAEDAAEHLAITSRIIQGFRLAPVPLDLRGLDRELVGLGSYLVNGAGGCNDCHTNPPYAPGGDPFAGERERINVQGYLAGGTEFGSVVSRDLTPDRRGRPGGLTFAEFRLSLRRGIDADDPGRLLQVMPWPVYSGLIDRDIAAIYEYLKSTPKIVSPTARVAAAPPGR